MSTPSYVGVLDADGRTYHTRYVHFDGGPETMPYMLAAVWWHNVRPRRRRHRAGAAGPRLSC